jgi:hypothetical protein
MTLLRQIDACRPESLPNNRKAGPLSRSPLALFVAQSDCIDPCVASKVILAPLQKSTSSTALRRGHQGRRESLNEGTVVLLRP